MEIPSILWALDSNTGETEYRALVNTMRRVPELQRFQHEFPRNFRFPSTDKHGANIRAENAYKTANVNINTCPIYCTVHPMATALKQSLGVTIAKETVSGMVNIALAVTGSGSVATLRSILQDVFRTDLQIVYDNPPEGEIAKHRGEVLDLFCSVHSRGQTRVNRKRRFVLVRFGNSNLEEEEVVHFCPFGCCPSPEMTLYYFQTYVTWALIPHRCNLFQRKGWTGADRSFDWGGLLKAHWNLLPKLIIRFTGYVQPPLALAASVVPSADPEADSEPDFVSSLLAELLGAASSDPDPASVGPDAANDDDRDKNEDDDGGDKSASQWAMENKKHKQKAGSFVSITPYSHYAIVRQCMQPGLQLIYNAMDMASKTWEKKQQLQASSGKKRTYRVLETAKGTLLKKCFRHIFRLLMDVPLALPATCYTREARSLQFRILSAHLCSLHALLRVFHLGMPFQIFLLMIGECEHVFALGRKQCSRESFSEWFFSEFPDEESMTDEAQVLLECQAKMIEVDVSNLESGHSTVREYTLQRARGHTASHKDVSAKSSCRFVGRAYNVEDQQLKEQHAKPPGPPGETENTGNTGTTKTKRRGTSGGAWRAFLSDKAQKTKLTAPLLKQLAQEYRLLSFDESERYRETGAAATTASRNDVKHPYKPQPAAQPAAQPALVDAVFGHVLDLVVIEPEDRIASFDPDKNFVEHYDDFKKRLPLDTQKKNRVKLLDEQLAKSSAEGVKRNAKMVSSLKPDGTGAGLVAGLTFESSNNEKLSSFSWVPSISKLVQATYLT